MDISWRLLQASGGKEMGERIRTRGKMKSKKTTDSTCPVATRWEQMVPPI